MAERERLLSLFPQFLRVKEGEAALNELCRLAKFEQYKVSDAIIERAFKRIEKLDESDIYTLQTTNLGNVSDIMEMVFGYATVKKYKKQRSLRRPLKKFIFNYAAYRYFDNHPDFSMDAFMQRVEIREYWWWYRSDYIWTLILKGVNPDTGNWEIFRTPYVRSKIEALKQRYDLEKDYDGIYDIQIFKDDEWRYLADPVIK